MHSVGNVAAAAAMVTDQLLRTGTRLSHTRAVADSAKRYAAAVPTADRWVVEAAAWLHDIGYAPAVQATGFHALDGARFLEQAGVDERLVSLVAHHSCARYEAAERRLEPELMRFRLPDLVLLDAVTAADMTTGPAGQPLEVEQRIMEILDRYPVSHPVHRATLRARPELVGAVRRAQRLLDEAAA